MSLVNIHRILVKERKKVEPELEDMDHDYALLKCPACKGVEGLHHCGVEIYDRNEDAEKCRLVSVGDDVCVTEADNYGNPSGRRSGIRVHFWCELCGTVTALTIAQHKGTTEISSEVTKRKIIRAEDVLF